jgi:hypothetical protein
MTASGRGTGAVIEHHAGAGHRRERLRRISGTGAVIEHHADAGHRRARLRRISRPAAALCQAAPR